METQANAWYARWFTWSCRVLDRFAPRGYTREYRYEFQTNLCHFFRTILLGTLAALVSLILWAAAIYVVIIMPLMLFPLAGLGFIVLLILGCTAAAVALLFLVFGAATLAERAPAMVDRLRGRIERRRAAPGFASVAWAWLVGIKQRFCPTIRFER